jgi:hypothetical protein
MKTREINKYEVEKREHIYLIKGAVTRANAGSWERPAAGNTQTNLSNF